MKVHLLHPDMDPRTTGDLPDDSGDLMRDLGLDTLFDQMSRGEPFLREVASRTVLTPLQGVEDILWRQDVLDDCLRHPAAARALYGLAVEALESKKKVRAWFLGQWPTATLGRSIEILEALLEQLRQLHQFAEEHAGDFRSRGLNELCAVIEQDLPGDYFLLVQEHLARLKFPAGVTMTAELGKWGKSTHYVLRKTRTIKRTWRDFLGLARPGELTYRLADRDEAGGRALAELKDRGLNLVADALAQSTDHILSFFTLLRWEMGFYIACVNLHEELVIRNLPTALPSPQPAAASEFTARALYDICLGLRIAGGDVVGNDLDADGKSLVMITGTNQGGKSTLLRSVGLAQMMMQSGMFVPADRYRASISSGMHTHFSREEDTSMESGKLDEELARMSQIIDHITPDSILLFNESFACTNEREGSRIARQIIDGLTEAHIRVFFVTHLYDLAHGLAAAQPPGALFLRPERLADGRRTFKVVPGDPLPTSYGQDLYEKVFGVAAAD